MNIHKWHTSPKTAEVSKWRKLVDVTHPVILNWDGLYVVAWETTNIAWHFLVILKDTFPVLIIESDWVFNLLGVSETWT